MKKFLRWVKKNVRPTAKLIKNGDKFNLQEDGAEKTKDKLKDKLAIGFKFKF